MAVAKQKIKASNFKEDIDKLLDGIVNGTDEHWQNYANQISEEVSAGLKIGIFKTWSPNNRMLLRAQAHARGHSVHGIYAGENQWAKRERTIVEGEKPFYIYGPPSYIVRGTTEDEDENTDPQATPNRPAPGTRVWRRPPLIPVYDYTQTQSTDPYYEEPNWALPLAGGNLETLQRLVELSPVPVRFKHMAARRERGWLDKTGITIDSSQSISQQIWTMAHELAHYHLGHLEQLGSTQNHTERKKVRERAEQEAAMAQYFILKMLGLDEEVGMDITAAASSYLRSWIKIEKDGTETPLQGRKSRRRLLKKRFADTFSVAQNIVTEFAENLEKEEQRTVSNTVLEEVAVH